MYVNKYIMMLKKKVKKYAKKNRIERERKKKETDSVLVNL